MKVVRKLRNEGVDYRLLATMQMTIIRDYFQQAFKIQTQVEVEVFRQLAIQRLSLPLDSDILEEMCTCLQSDTNEDYISMKKLQLLVELYQMLPMKVNAARNHSRQMGAVFQDTVQPVMSRTIDTTSHRRSETISVKSVKVPDMSKDEVLLRQSL